MIGPTVTAPRNAIQPLVKPIKFPKAYRGKRALPPATGYIPPSSACVNARSITTPPPSTQEMTAAGPASDEAYNAPNNQPAPMIDPKDAKRSPSKPMSRRSVRPARSGRATSGCASSAVTLTPSNMAARDLLEHGPDHGPSPFLTQLLFRESPGCPPATPLEIPRFEASISPCRPRRLRRRPATSGRHLGLLAWCSARQGRPGQP